jgi:hypothetical protein
VEVRVYLQVEELEELAVEEIVVLEQVVRE